jgi:hypothetical protein
VTNVIHAADEMPLLSTLNVTSRCVLNLIYATGHHRKLHQATSAQPALKFKFKFFMAKFGFDWRFDCMLCNIEALHAIGSSFL